MINGINGSRGRYVTASITTQNGLNRAKIINAW